MLLAHTQLTTFDGKYYQVFPHECAYTLVHHCHSGGPSKFTVTLVNKECDDAYTSCSQQIRLSIADKPEIVIDRISQQGAVVTVGSFATVSYADNDTRVTVLGDRNVLVSVNIGSGSFQLISSGQNIYFSVSPDLENKTCGLCGTFNRKGNDDYHLRSGINAIGVDNFLQEWKDKDWSDNSCPSTSLGGLKDYCNIHSQRVELSKEICSVLEDTEGPFKSCFDKVPVLDYRTKCRDSACRCGDCACDVISGYARVCSEKGAIIPAWRKGLSQCNREYDEVTFFIESSVNNTRNPEDLKRVTCVHS